MRNWRKTLLKLSAPLSEAIRILGKESLRIAMVVDGQDRLLGTITDGDIRRALVKQVGMNTSVGNIMFTNPTTASVDDDRNVILAMMKNMDILQIPILDHDGRVVDLETLQCLLEPTKLKNPVFLMAGGFGTRLRPLTDDTPKPMLKVGSKPILETILLQFVEAGFYDFYISTHYKAEKIREHFGDGGKWGVNISYVHEEKPLGTAGALGLLPDDIEQLPLIMMNGDLLTKVNLRQLLDFHVAQDCIATMCVRKYDFQVPYGVIEQKNNIVSEIIEKPIHKFFVNAGIYVLDPVITKSVESDQCIDMPMLLEKQITEKKKIAAFPVHEYWLDVGRLEEFERANREALQ